MKYISTILLLFCLTMMVKAQSNYKQGYIITNKNDTIRGLIDFRSDVANSEHCKFKLTENSKEDTYYPGDILGYMFINEIKFYVTRTININKEQSKVFLEYLVQGLKDLYYYPKDNGYYFIEDENGKMICVTKEPDKIIDNKYKVDNKYKGFLKYAFRDCTKMANDIEKADFARKDLIKLTREYHTQMCSPGQECIVFENDYRKSFIKLDFSVYGGFQFADYIFKNSELTVYNSAKSLSPIVGLQANVSSPRIMKSISFQFDASMSKIKGEKDIIENSSIAPPSTYQNFKFNALESTLSLGIKYTYLKGVLHPTIGGGFCYSKLFNSSNSLYTESRNSNDFTEKIVSNYYSLAKSFIGYNYEIGIDYQLNNGHYFFLQTIYNKMFDFNANMNRTQIKVGYSF